MILVAVVLADDSEKLFARLKFPEEAGAVAYGFRDVIILDEVRPSHVGSEVDPNVSGGDLCVELGFRQFKMVEAVPKARIEPL